MVMSLKQFKIELLQTRPWQFLKFIFVIYLLAFYACIIKKLFTPWMPNTLAAL